MKSLTFLIIITFGFAAKPQSLLQKNLSFFYKCHGQLLGKRPRSSDPILEKILTGKKTGLNGCLELIDSYSTPDDPSKIEFLKLLVQLHSSWFKKKNLFRACEDYTMPEHYNSQVAGEHFTYNFLENAPVERLFKGKHHIRADRKSPKSSDFFYFKSDLSNNYISRKERRYFSAAHENQSPGYVPRGRLTGLKKLAVRKEKVPRYEDPKKQEKLIGEVPTFPHLGGGLLGTADYIRLNIENRTFDGGMLSYRSYGESVFRDFLCRELPILKKSEAKKIEDESHYLPFRNQGRCISCHSPIDSVGKLIGHSFWSRTFRGGNDNFHFENMIVDKKPFEARINFTDIYGNSIRKKIKGLDGLGDLIASTDDFYFCLSRRYYHFVTGVRVDMKAFSIKGPQRNTHVRSVFENAMSFKKHRRLKKLLQDTYASAYNGGNK